MAVFVLGPRVCVFANNAAGKAAGEQRTPSSASHALIAGADGRLCTYALQQHTTSSALMH